ncbi:MAG: LysM peptidoglycan-binding domain-containing protein, partial [Chloroflexi bacterium]
ATATTENVWSVAQRYGLRPLTLLMNNIEYPGNGGGWDLGPDLVIPPVDGTLYTVQPGDSLESIALRHNIRVEAITDFELNRLEEPNELQPGRLLMLPGSTRSYRYGLYYGSALFGGVVYPPDAPEGSGSFAWPAQGLLTQGYRSGHYAIDIANDAGTPVVAADHGYVILAGKDLAGAGNQVLIGHGNGFTTRYTHLDTILVKTGDVVTKGQQIGTMGSTGQAPAPHLHFEIVAEGLRRNPLSYLP